MKSSKSLTVFMALAMALALLTGAVAAPILCRPFYYAHIGPLNLEERTGLTEEEIRTAYDEMLDYCLGGEEFSTGVLKWSESGKSHFTDVRFLFQLDLNVLACTAGAPGPRPCWAGGPPSGPGPGWGRCSWRWPPWPPWTSTGPLWCSTPCFSPARTTGSLTQARIRSSPSCPRRFSETAPSLFWAF